MLNGSNGYSLSDIAAASGNNEGGFGGGGAWWIIILFLFVFCGWGGNGGLFGGGNGAVPNAMTQQDLARGFDMTNLSSGLRDIQTNLSDGFYAQNSALLQGYNALGNAVNSNAAALQSSLCQGFNGINTGILTSANQLQQGINAVNTTSLLNTNQIESQLANCCCENREAIAQVRYDLATNACAVNTNTTNNTRDIIEASTNNTRAILDAIQQNKVDAMQDRIAALTAQNQSLQFAASQAMQNATLLGELRPSPIPAYTVSNPYAGYGTCGCATYA